MHGVCDGQCATQYLPGAPRSVWYITRNTCAEAFDTHGICTYQHIAGAGRCRCMIRNARALTCGSIDRRCSPRGMRNVSTKVQARSFIGRFPDLAGKRALVTGAVCVHLAAETSALFGRHRPRCDTKMIAAARYLH